MSYQSLPFSTAKDATNATIVVHPSGVGGPPKALSSQGAYRDGLFKKGLYYALFKAGFKEVEEVSVFENTFLDKGTVNQVGESLGEKLDLKDSGVENMGFPFNLPFGQDLYNPSGWMDNVNILTPKLKVYPQGTVKDINDVPSEIISKYMHTSNLKNVYLDEAIKNLQVLRWTHTLDYLKSMNALLNGGFLIHWGGTHDTDIGLMAAVGTLADRAGLKVGYIVFDAHGDFNNPQISPSGNLHGQHISVHTAHPLMYFKENYFARLGQQRNSHYILQKVNPKNVLHIGANALDPLEAIAMKEAGINVLAMPDIEKYKKMGRLVEVFEELYHKATKGVDALVLSLDCDVMAPDVITPNGRLAVTMPDGELLPDDLKMMLGIVAQGKVGAVSITELNRAAGHDPEGNSFKLVNDIIYGFLSDIRKN